MMHTQSYLAYSIRQGGMTHDRIAELRVVSVIDGNVSDNLHFETSPNNLKDVWSSVSELFNIHSHAIAYNLVTHRSNLDRSLEAVGVTPPTIKQLCLFQWSKLLTGLSDSYDIQQHLGYYYDNAASIPDLVNAIYSKHGQTIAHRYTEIHNAGRNGASNFFRSIGPSADLNGLKWIEGDVALEGFWIDKTVVITGDFQSYPDRKVLSKILESRGAIVTSSISGKTNLVVVGDGAGPSKLNKVRQLVSDGKDLLCLNETHLSTLLITE